MADSQTAPSLPTSRLNDSFKGSSDLFKFEDRPPIAKILNGITAPIPYAVATGSGLIDIVKDFKWKNSGNASEVPTLTVTEFELEYGTWTRNLANVLDIVDDLAQGTAIDPYIQMYASKKTGFWYRFPWLLKGQDNIRTVTTTWGENEGAKLLGKFAGGMAAGLAGIGTRAMIGGVTPAIGFEQIQEYKETTNQTLNVTFPLYNTGYTEEAYRNYSFVSLFTFQNLKTRTSLMTYIPPHIYTIDSNALGGIYWPVAYVSELKIDSIGNTRHLSEFSNGQTILIPEAYKVSITFKELLPQSSNIFAGSIGGKKIEVTNPFEFLNQNNQAAEDALNID